MIRGRERERKGEREISLHKLFISLFITPLLPKICRDIAAPGAQRSSAPAYKTGLNVTVPHAGLGQALVLGNILIWLLLV